MILFNLICNMTVFWKSWMLTTPQVSGGGVGGGLWVKYLLPCCWIRDSLKLICNMTMFWKSWILTFWTQPPPPPPVHPVDRTQALDQNHVWYASYLLYLCLHVKSVKILTNELLRNLNIWPLIPPEGSGGWGKILITVMLMYRHWVIMAY